MSVVELTDDFIESFKRGDAVQEYVFDSVLKGFGVTFGANKITFWIRARIDGKQRKESIGTWVTQRLRDIRRGLSVQDARRIAGRRLDELRSGTAELLAEARFAAAGSRLKKESAAKSLAPIGPPVRFRIVGVYTNGAERDLTAVEVTGENAERGYQRGIGFQTDDEEFAIFIARRPLPDDDEQHDEPQTLVDRTGAPF